MSPRTPLPPANRCGSSHMAVTVEIPRYTCMLVRHAMSLRDSTHACGFDPIPGLCLVLVFFCREQWNWHSFAHLKVFPFPFTKTLEKHETSFRKTLRNLLLKHKSTLSCVFFGLCHSAKLNAFTPHAIVPHAAFSLGSGVGKLMSHYS